MELAQWLFLSKQSAELKPLQTSLEVVTIVITINVVIGGLSGEN